MTTTAATGIDQDRPGTGLAIEAVERSARRAGRINAATSVLAAVVFLAVIAAAETLLNVFDVSEWILPRPSSVAAAWIDGFAGVILPHTLVTLTEVLVGLAIGAVIGISLGALISQYQVLDKILSPFILILITTPVVALVPLLMLWFGYGMETKIISAAIASFPPLMMNTLSGLSKVPTLQEDLMVYLGASSWTKFRLVRIYNALPSLVTGFTIAAIFALITTVSAEFVGGSVGLGNRLIFYASTVQTAMMFAIIATLAGIGIAMYLTITGIGRKLIHWT